VLYCPVKGLKGILEVRKGTSLFPGICCIYCQKGKSSNRRGNGVARRNNVLCFPAKGPQGMLKSGRGRHCYRVYEVVLSTVQVMVSS